METHLPSILPTASYGCPDHTKLKVHFFVDELVSYSDFHGGPTLCNLYDNVGDGHHALCRSHLDAWGPPPKTYGLSAWPSFVALHLFFCSEEVGHLDE